MSVAAAVGLEVGNTLHPFVVIEVEAILEDGLLLSELVLEFIKKDLHL